MTRLRAIFGPGHTQADYHRALAAGYETGFWDDNGVPAPWPDDFNDNDDPVGHDQTDTEPLQNGAHPPF